MSLRQWLAKVLHPPSSADDKMVAEMRAAVGRLDMAGDRMDKASARIEEATNKLDPLGDLVEGLRGEKARKRKCKPKKRAVAK